MPLRTLSGFAFAAIAADFATSYAALTAASHRYAEVTPATAGLIAALGLFGGLAVSALVRGAAFGSCVLAARRYPRLEWPLLAIGAAGIAYTAALAVGNGLLLAAS